jgi:hypothetical protein
LGPSSHSFSSGFHSASAGTEFGRSGVFDILETSVIAIDIERPIQLDP